MLVTYVFAVCKQGEGDSLSICSKGSCTTVHGFARFKILLGARLDSKVMEKTANPNWSKYSPVILVAFEPDEVCGDLDGFFCRGCTSVELGQPVEDISEKLVATLQI